MGYHLASSLKQVTARAWGACVLARPQTSDIGGLVAIMGHVSGGPEIVIS